MGLGRQAARCVAVSPANPGRLAARRVGSAQVELRVPDVDHLSGIHRQRLGRGQEKVRGGLVPHAGGRAEAQIHGVQQVQPCEDPRGLIRALGGGATQVHPTRRRGGRQRVNRLCHARKQGGVVEAVLEVVGPVQVGTALHSVWVQPRHGGRQHVRQGMSNHGAECRRIQSTFVAEPRHRGQEAHRDVLAGVHESAVEIKDNGAHGDRGAQPLTAAIRESTAAAPPDNRVK